MNESTEDKLRRLEHERIVRELLEQERAKSDRIYAIKLVERIVFGMIGLLAIGVVGALLRVVLIP